MSSITRLLIFLPPLLASGCAPVPLAEGDGAPAEASSSDGAPTDAACSERIWQALGSPPSIRVTCRNGTVYLRGTVAMPESRRALVEFVRQQPGVKTVVDRLAIR